MNVWRVPMHYILDEMGEPIPVDDVMTWAAWFETHDRRLLKDAPARGVEVSTVFLSLDHSFTGGPPVLWETMIFGGPFDEWQDRYTSNLDALRGHARAVALVNLHRAAPRKTKKALVKWWAAGAAFAIAEPRLGASERRRLLRALGRIGWDQ